MPGKRPAEQKKSTPAKPPARPAGGLAPGTDRLTQLERLIELMVQKDVVEVELEEGETRWRVRRTEPQAMTFAAPPGMGVPGMAMPAMAMPGGGHGASAAGGAAASPPEPQGEVFKSPMLGTFYRASAPGAPPFANEGDIVAADATVCLIEVMKLFNTLKAGTRGRIVRFLVENGTMVEFDQPLLLIDPRAE